MKIKTMQDLYLDLLRDMYNGETQMVKALPKMAESAVSQELQTAFTSHLAETKQQVQRLEQIFKSLDENPSGEDCEAMKGLIEEAEDMIDDGIEANVMDAALIASAQKIEHYEIGSYGTLCEFAKQLGLNDQAAMLHDTLEEEKGADKKLTALAKDQANRTALRAAA